MRIDPQQRLLLELAWEALEDAGLPPATLRGSKTGVFVGISVSEYGMMLANDLAQTDAHAAAGTSLCLAANRLSFAFGLQGPSVALDTACSSSLVALHLACQSIRNGECDAALVGGVNLLLSPVGTINLTKAGFCAADGRVRAFDAAASGYVRSEGAGLVVLKPLAAALKDRDSDLRRHPRQRGQPERHQQRPDRPQPRRPGAGAARGLSRGRKVSPGQVQFVETQGTGTPLGDTIEALALGSVLREGRPPDRPCAIGSVKTNIGHLEAASGIASLMKAALALKHRQLPPNLHFHTPNPDIPFSTLPLRVQQTLEPWPETAQPRHRGRQRVRLRRQQRARGAGRAAAGGPGRRRAGQREDAVPAQATGDGPAGALPALPLLLSARTEKALHASGRALCRIPARRSAPLARRVLHRGRAPRTPRLPPGSAGRFAPAGRRPPGKFRTRPTAAGRLCRPKAFRPRAGRRLLVRRSGGKWPASRLADAEGHPRFRGGDGRTSMRLASGLPADRWKPWRTMPTAAILRRPGSPWWPCNLP